MPHALVPVLHAFFHLRERRSRRCESLDDLESGDLGPVGLGEEEDPPPLHSLRRQREIHGGELEEVSSIGVVGDDVPPTPNPHPPDLDLVF